MQDLFKKKDSFDILNDVNNQNIDLLECVDLNGGVGRREVSDF